MSGPRITDQQVRLFMDKRKHHSQEVAAAKTGISVRTARRIERDAALPSQKPRQSWRTRPHALVDVWDSEVVPLLRNASHLMGITVCERSCQRTNDVYDFDIRGPTMLSCVVLLEYDLGMIAALPMHERANRVVLHHPISSGWRHVEHPVSATKSTPGSRLATLHRDRSLAVQPGGRPPGPEAGCAA